ncbi:MAG: UbiA prenyltransferase [Chloroflexi bacterium]|nr:UbiA prenyltransferase [Chloroflexota bacterium]
MDVGKAQSRAAMAPQPVAPPIAIPGLILKAMRPRQWTKNLLCGAALVMANRLRDGASDLRMVFCILLFCALSGSIYLLNDSLDAERDRLHPTKRLRPVASGRLPVRVAQRAAVLIGAVSLLLCLLLGFPFFEVALAYMVLQFGYVFYLKHEVLLDVFAIALGYVLRAAAGAVAIHVEISVWLYLCTILGGLFLALGKRRQELIELEDGAADHRQNLGEYSLELVDQLITIVSASTIVAYSLYTFTAPNLPANHQMMVTVPFAVYGIFRYLYLVHQHGQGGSPEEVLLRDRPLQACILLWGAIAIVVVSGSGHGP